MKPETKVIIDCIEHWVLFIIIILSAVVIGDYIIDTKKLEAAKQECISKYDVELCNEIFN